MPASPRPSGPVTIRMYNVGFGDCFLLTFPYATGGNRHVLIDFGSFPSPKQAPKGFKEAIAADIAHQVRGGKLAVVATHRHADHINGFATNAHGTASGDLIAGLKPAVVIQPWTEHPDAARTAHRAPAFRAAALRFHRSLAAQQAFAQAFVARLPALPKFLDRDVRQELAFIGEDAVKNKSAVKNLMTMGTRKPKYVHAGSASGLETFLPGVKVHVLGPPTIEQEPEIEAYAKKSAEYWILQRRSLLGAAGRPRKPGRSLFPRARRASRPPAHATWFIDRLQRSFGQQLLAIVTLLDDVLNNTSLILLFEVGDQKLLFPGDAQLENWTYALRQYPTLLAGVTVYKVGHHGSLNATPKTLWRQLTEADTAVATAKFQTLMSTMAGVHGGKGGRPTEVPRGPLVDALRGRSQPTTTLDRQDYGQAQVVRA